MATQLTTRDGRPWQPRYLDGIDADACIGCGRCYKACGRSVMAPIDRPFDEDIDDEEDHIGGMVMSVVDAGDCIGCEACARACAKRAHLHLSA